jgi:hypothetical protein
MTKPTETDEPKSDWDTARDRATILRLRRSEPSVARRRANQWLVPVLTALWIVSIGAHLLALLDTHAQDTLQLVGSSTALVLIILGFIWLFVGGQFNVSNRYESPWTPLTKSDRRRVRRQLACKAPLELQHADVLLELAHQQRRQTVGALAIFAIELPNSLGVALTDPDPIVLTLTSLGLALFLGLGLYSIVVATRLKTPIRELTKAASRSASAQTAPPQL